MQDNSDLPFDEHITKITKDYNIPNEFLIEQYYNEIHNLNIIDILSKSGSESFDTYLDRYYNLNNQFKDYMTKRLAKVSPVSQLKEFSHIEQLRDDVRYHGMRIQFYDPKYDYKNRNVPKFGDYNTIENVKIRSPDDYKNNVNVNVKSPLGGLTNQQIKYSPFVCLRHDTLMESIIDIFERGGLEHRLLLGKEGIPVKPGYAGAYPEESVEDTAKGQLQFPGSYFYIENQRNLLLQSPLNKYDIRYPDKDRDKVTLMFSLALLQQKNWHLNMIDNYGAITNETFSPITLSKYLTELPILYGYNECGVGYCREELVIHDKVPLKFCEGIIVKAERTKRLLSVHLRHFELDIPVYLESDEFILSLVNLQFVRHINQFDEMNPSPPNYCYTGNKGDSPYEVGLDEQLSLFDHINPYTLKYVRSDDRPGKTNQYDANGKMFNVNEENIYMVNQTLKNCNINEQYDGTNDAKVYHKIEDKMEDIYFGSGVRPIVRSEPPFRYTPDYYKL